MSDNTTINVGTGGDSIRTIERTSTNVQTNTTTSVKTQAFALDIGGDTTDPSTEVLVSNANPMPVDSADHAVSNAILIAGLRLQMAAASGVNGFVPVEIPDFLTGV